jgi:hypothetical protein
MRRICSSDECRLRGLTWSYGGRRGYGTGFGNGEVSDRMDGYESEEAKRGEGNLSSAIDPR